MDVFLMIRRHKTTIFTDAKENTSVTELKKMIGGILKVSPSNQILFYYGNDPMANEKLLQDYGITMAIAKAQAPAQLGLVLRNNSIAPINQLLVALRFFATANHLLSLADFGGMHVSIVSRIVLKVSRAIARLANDYIKFPETSADISRTKRDFFEIASFPNVIGAIDGTQIKIQSPGGVDAEVFRNRKSYFSINVQAICNAKMIFTNVVA